MSIGDACFALFNVKWDIPHSERDMGFYELYVYEDYVKAHAGRDALRELTHAREAFDDYYDNVLVGYDSMAEWMYFLDLITLNDHDVKFSQLRGVYQQDKAEYMSQVKSRLNQIKGRMTGLSLLEEIKRSAGQEVIINPYHGKDRNADADVRTRARSATARGRPVDYSCTDHCVLGTGAGTGSTSHFTPGMWTGSEMHWEGSAPDEVLFHELVHASREMRGVFDQRPVNMGYGNEEEYLAVLLSNIYLSEKGQVVFRASHGDWDEGTGPPKRANKVLQGLDADYFLSNVQKVNLPPKQLIEEFRWSQHAFYFDLAGLPPPPGGPKYNWVKQYREEQRGNYIF